jgi:hypothetical protein
MPVVITLDVATGQRTALAPGFCAILPRSRFNPGLVHDRRGR